MHSSTYLSVLVELTSFPGKYQEPNFLNYLFYKISFPDHLQAFLQVKVFQIIMRMLIFFGHLEHPNFVSFSI